MKRLGVVFCIAACGDVESKKPDARMPDTPMVQIDAPMIDAPPGPRCDATKPFGTGQLLTAVNSTSEDVLPFLTADELQLWFASNRAGGLGALDIWMASRASVTAAFGTPVLVANVNTSGQDGRPTLTADGLNIYIEYRALPTTGPYRIRTASRSSTSAGFSTPTEVPILASTVSVVAPYVLGDHSAIYFVSTGTVGSSDVFRAARSGGVFQTPVQENSLSSVDSEDYPAVAPDDRTIYVTSRRGGMVENDIWKSQRPNTVQAYPAPTNVTEINTTGGDTMGWVSADDCVMYLHKTNGANASDLFVYTKPQ